MKTDDGRTRSRGRKRTTLPRPLKPTERDPALCKATTKAGMPCMARATEGGLCFFHANPNKAAELGRLGGQTTPVRSGNGWSNWNAELHAMLSSLPSPTNWHGSPGQCYPVANAIAPRLQPWLLKAMEKIARLENARVFHFSTARRLRIKFLSGSARKNRRMKQQSNGVPENLVLVTVEITDGFIRTGTRDHHCAPGDESPTSPTVIHLIVPMLGEPVSN